MKNLKTTINEISETVELVGKGHPDRFCDFLAEELVNYAVKEDKSAKLGIEIMMTWDYVYFGGESSFSFYDDVLKDILKTSLKKIYGVFYKKFEHIKIINNIAAQSDDLAALQKGETVSGDQGIVYGFFDLKRIQTIHDLETAISISILNFPEIWSDWKAIFNFRTKELKISFCGKKQDDFFYLMSLVLKDRLGHLAKTIVINDVQWEIGGSISDTGMTNRKLMVDNFGAGIPHGGGGINGKDVSKVDKTGVIWSNLIARQISMKKKLAPVLVKMVWTIGKKQPEEVRAFVFKKKKIVSSLVNIEKFVFPSETTITSLEELISKNV